MKRQPYRLNKRSALTAEPPFTVELVQELVGAALFGPKGRATKRRGEPSAEFIRRFTAILNN